MDLEKVKKHIRAEDFENDNLEMYIEWAVAEIKDSVSTAKVRNELYFEKNIHFEKAVILLASHYFENRLPMTEVKMNNLPYGITSAIHKLRGGYHDPPGE
jgi:uncharacterized phage protein (predicted DNA packaging)